MKMFKHVLKTIAIMAIVLGCSNTTETSKEEDLAELQVLNDEIQQLIATGICSSNTDCYYIAFGSKACGGPTSYLVYSTSIDVNLLKEKVAAYNEKEDDFNKKWGIISDCSVVSPPNSVTCVQGKCSAIYN
jgi:hypothetical protein